MSGVFTLSCSKSDDSASVAARIQGKWEWKESVGGMDGGSIRNPETVKYTRQLILSEGKAVLTLNDKDTVQNTTYKVRKEKSILTDQDFEVLTINYNFEAGEGDILRPLRYLIIKVDEDTLLLAEDVYDGFGHTYVK